MIVAGRRVRVTIAAAESETAVTVAMIAVSVRIAGMDETAVMMIGFLA